VFRNEVYFDFYVKDCSQKLWTAMAAMVINPTERGFILLRGDDEMGKSNKSMAAKLEKYGVRSAADTEQSNDDNAAQNGSSSKSDGKRDVLTLEILRNEALCGTVLDGIKRSLSWRDSACQVRVSQFAAKLVGIIGSNELSHLYRSGLRSDFEGSTQRVEWLQN